MVNQYDVRVTCISLINRLVTTKYSLQLLLPLEDEHPYLPNIQELHVQPIYVAMQAMTVGTDQAKEMYQCTKKAMSTLCHCQNCSLLMVLMIVTTH